MSSENIKTDFILIVSDTLLENSIQIAINERQFQETEVIRLKYELNRLKNMRDNNINYDSQYTSYKK
jgi:hypothetical protein